MTKVAALVKACVVGRMWRRMAFFRPAAKTKLLER